MSILKKQLLPLIGAIVCIWGITQAYSFGMSSLYAVFARALAQNDINAGFQAADKAIAYCHSNPEAHLAKAKLLLEQKKYPEVDAEIQEAIKLLPRDYFVWLELGRARDFAGKDVEALAAFYKAASLAPAYADVSWQLGNTLLRSGKSAEGFAELRKAATRNSSLWLSLIDLAVSLSSSAKQSEDLLKPDTNEAYLAFATYYAMHKMPTEALRLFGQAKLVSEIDQTALLNLLFTAKHFDAAYKIWLLGEGKQFAEEGLIINRGFEFPLNPEEKWFGWNTVKTPNVLVVKTDFEAPKSGARSLRIDFTGEVPVGSNLVWQYVPVASGTSYKLSFFVRTKDIISGGLPMINIVGISGDKREKLASSGDISTGSTSWRKFELAFSVAQNSQAISLELMRNGCNTSPCPIFGSLWLDDFSLR